MLNKGNETGDTIKCRLCGSQAHVALQRMIVLQQFQVTCYLCEACGLLQTESPYWLTEAYKKAISRLDTGILQRNLTAMRVVSILIMFFGGRQDVFLDYGGGHGIFTRLMRDHGYDFRWLDHYAENLYSDGFEYKDGIKITGITAFELLEHLENPREVFATLLGKLKPKFLLATTTMFVDPVDPEWDYFSISTGQHIAFYQEKTMEHIARQYGYHWSNWRHFHLFSQVPLPKIIAKLLIPFSRIIFPVIAPLLRANSRHIKDHQFLSSEKR